MSYEIMKLIFKINRLSEEMKKIKTVEYKCNHYDTYKDDYENAKEQWSSAKGELVEYCNDYIHYPKKRLFQKKVKVKEETLWGSVLEIPYIDKKEYYCLINQLDKINLIKIGDENYVLSMLLLDKEKRDKFEREVLSYDR